jgi:hypothetical protein
MQVLLKNHCNMGNWWRKFATKLMHYLHWCGWLHIHVVWPPHSSSATP